MEPKTRPWGDGRGQVNPEIPTLKEGASRTVGDCRQMEEAQKRTMGRSGQRNHPVIPHCSDSWKSTGVCS